MDETLGFRFGSLDGDATCAWKDLSGDEGDLWEFVSSKVRIRVRRKAEAKSVPKATNALFELTVLHCIFERVRLVNRWS